MKLIDEELIETLLAMINENAEELAKDWQVDVVIRDLKTLRDAHEPAEES